MTDVHHAAARTQSEAADLVVHRACLRLRGNTPYGYQACRCEPAVAWPDVDVSRAADLCAVCARGPAGGVTRYSWLGCVSCRAVELELREWLGICVTPLGRHSLMNGVGVRVAGAIDADREAFVTALEGLDTSWTRLGQWADSEARHLERQLATKAPEIPLTVWRQVFPASLDASVDAYERMLQIRLPVGTAERAATRLAGDRP